MTRATILLTCASFACACTTITHADDYEVQESVQDDRLCAMCPGRSDLLHPPCPSEKASAEGDQVLYFALRALDLGTRASGWTAGYNVGLDQDCSDRPSGNPVQCAQRNPLTGFERLANGVDNALATQVLYPLIQAVEVNPQTLINEALDRATGGVLLIIDGWNGTSDDDHVGVRMLPALAAAGVPAWDGTDRWIAFADRYDPAFPGQKVPHSDNETRDGYIAGGKLVWDARSLATFLMPFGSADAIVDVRLSNVVFVGDLLLDSTPRQLVNAAMAGVWSAFLASRNAVHLAEIVARCDSCIVNSVTPMIEDLVADAPDMLLPTSAGASTCDGISVGFLGSYIEVAGVVDIVPISAIPRSCANAAPCEQ